MTALSIHPRIEIYRTEEGGWYLLVEMALVNPGHYVGWGQLREMSRAEFAVGGRDCVVTSLREFLARDGRDKGRRLKLVGREPFHVRHDCVSVKAVAPTQLELTPCQRGPLQHQPLEGQRRYVDVAITAHEFFSAMSSAFEEARR